MLKKPRISMIILVVLKIKKRITKNYLAFITLRITVLVMETFINQKVRIFIRFAGGRYD